MDDDKFVESREACELVVPNDLLTSPSTHNTMHSSSVEGQAQGTPPGEYAIGVGLFESSLADGTELKVLKISWPLCTNPSSLRSGLRDTSQRLQAAPPQTTAGYKLTNRSRLRYIN